MEFVLGLLLTFLHLSASQDCASLLSGGSTRSARFLWDDFNKYPDNLKPLLPRTTEVDRHCRFDLTKLSQGQKNTLKQLHTAGYPICVGCGYVNSDHGRCHSIDVCAKGSSCISGHNEQRIPTYYWHGCCSPTDSKCRTERVDFSVKVPSFGGKTYDATVHYQKNVCTGDLCNENGYTSQKTDLQAFLSGTATAPPPTTAATMTTVASTGGSVIAVDGGWTDWATWGACDKTCNLGIRTRDRACTNPAPANGGDDCLGTKADTELCNANPCPTAG